MTRKRFLAMAVLAALTAPAATQVHIARPTRDDAPVELAARPQPDSWTIHDLLTNGSVTLPGYPDCSGFTWHSEAVDTFGAVGVVTRIVGMPTVAACSKHKLATQRGRTPSPLHRASATASIAFAMAPDSQRGLARRSDSAATSRRVAPRPCWRAA